MERSFLNKKKIICIIQCRLGSTRFKKKSIKKLGNYTILEWVIRRVKLSKKINVTYLATTKKREDNKLVTLAKKLKIKVYRGSVNDVFSRFYQISEKEMPDFIIRVCADNPFIMPSEIDNLIDFALKRKADYSFNHIPYKNNNYIDGLGAECLSFSLLKKLDKIKKNSHEKEHVTMHIWKNKKNFKFRYFLAKGNSRDNQRDIRLDIDYEFQYQKFKKLLKSYKKKPEDFNVYKLIKKIKKTKKDKKYISAN